MREIWLSNTAGRIPTVNQLEIATAQMGYNRTDAKLYGLRVIDGVKTVVLLGQSTEANHDRLHSMVSAADHAATTPGVYAVTDASGNWQLEPKPTPGGGGVDNSTRLIEGSVLWLELLSFLVTDTQYKIWGQLYTTNAIEVELDASDPDNDRIDMICVNTSQEVIVLKGVAAANPAAPIPDPYTQLELTTILVKAGATAPEITTVQVYDENIEWTTSNLISGVETTSCDFESTVDPVVNTKCILITKTGDDGIKKLEVYFNGPDTALGEDANLSFRLKSSTAWLDSSAIEIVLKLNGAEVGNSVLLVGNNYGNNSTFPVWNTIVIPASSFGATGLTIDEIDLRFSYTYWFDNGNTISIDDVKLQFGDVVEPTAAQMQSDWEQVDNTQPDFIKNKPAIPDDQIQSDWSQANNALPDFIKNKPAIPDAQIQSDWNQINSALPDFLKNKPEIPAAQIQSDWNQTNSALPDFIKNKPEIPSGGGVTPVSDMLYWNTDRYSPYGSKQTSLVHFYLGTTYPTNTDRLNLDANIYSTKLNTKALTLDTFGTGTHSGTPAYALQVDANGNVIEGSISGGVTPESDMLNWDGTKYAPYPERIDNNEWIKPYFYEASQLNANYPIHTLPVYLDGGLTAFSLEASQDLGSSKYVTYYLNSQNGIGINFMSSVYKTFNIKYDVSESLVLSANSAQASDKIYIGSKTASGSFHGEHVVVDDLNYRFDINMTKVRYNKGTVNKYLKLDANKEVQYVDVPIQLAKFYTDVSNVGSSATDSFSYVLPANTLNENGKQIEIFTYGGNALNANAKEVYLWFGSNPINGIALQETYGSWKLHTTIIRISATEIRTQMEYWIGANGGGGTGTGFQVFGSINFAIANTIKLTLDGVSNGDITAMFETINLYQ